jgi:hypothetical protein
VGAQSRQALEYLKRKNSRVQNNAVIAPAETTCERQCRQWFPAQRQTTRRQYRHGGQDGEVTDHYRFAPSQHHMSSDIWDV